MTSLRPYLGLALCLLLALTSQSMAVARGAPGPTGQVVLCTGTGPVTILVGADGQPTGAVHICPDLALGLFAALDQTWPLPARRAGSTPLYTIEINKQKNIRLQTAFNPRGPPFAT